jgi:anti-anti-sigma factor
VSVTAESHGHAVVLNIKGELTEDSLAELRQVVDAQMRGKEIVDLVLNLENMPFIDSVSLEYLIDLQEQLTQKLGRVKLALPDENVAKVLEITRMDSMFEIFHDLNKAIHTIQV